MKEKNIFILLFILITLLILMIPIQSNASNDIIVALDPGHGGTEPGAKGGELVEKDLNWKIATRVKQILDNTPGITGVLTKSQNETLDRKTRAQRAKNSNADLLVSFHINAADGSNRFSGAEVYVTCDTKQKRYYEYSNMLGKDILKNLKNSGIPLFWSVPKTRLGTDPNDIYPDGTVADYYGIISWPIHNDIPSVLVEHCFIDNPSDRAKYLNDTALNKIAKADANAIIANKELFRRTYYGSINTDLKTMKIGTEANGRHYITGEILIAEWVNGAACVPQDLPEIKMKAVDGSNFEVGVNLIHNGGLSYSYYRVLDNLDLDKEYYLEAKLTSNKNLSKNKTQTVNMPNMTVGKYKNRTLKIKNNKMFFSDGGYIGAINTDLKDIQLNKNKNGKYYLSGNILIAEWIDGIACIPNKLPEMVIKSTDGSYSTGMHLVHNGGLSYTYDRIIDNLDITKEYEIEVKLTGINNKGTNKKQIAKLPNKEIGKYGTVKLIAKDNKLKMTDPTLYIGAINTDVKTMYVGKNEVGREYIHGNILIAEWINGVACIPKGLPELTLKSTDGSYSAKMHIVHEGGLNYYYDRVIYNLDTSKEYYIEAKLTGSKNIGENKVQKANINAKRKVGVFKNKNIEINNNKIVFKGNEYVGAINTDVKTMYVDKNEIGREYIHGNILIAEWINGVACVPNGLPELTLKSTDGSYSAKMHIVHEGGLNYYYDRVIYNLDTNKEYYIEAKLTNSNNIGKNKVQQANIVDKKEVGIFKENTKIVIKSNKIIFKKLATTKTKMKSVQKENKILEENKEKEITQENKNTNTQEKQNKIQTEKKAENEETNDKNENDKKEENINEQNVKNSKEEQTTTKNEEQDKNNESNKASHELSKEV